MINRDSVVKNSFWFGLETVVDAAVSLALSVAVARVIGPVRLGYYIYMMFMVNLAGRLAAFGPGAAARKYLSEYLARDDRGMARLVFFTMLRWNVQLACGFAAVGWVLIFALEDSANRLVASILVASLIGGVVNIVASQTNMAAENFARNVPASFVALAIYASTVILTLVFDLGPVGLAVALLLRRTVEMFLRLQPAIRWARQLPRIPAPPDLARRMMTFSGQGLAIAMLVIVVWDRSELVFLRHFCRIQEVTFYSVAFSLTETLLLLPTAIGAAVSARFMAEHGRTQAIGDLASSPIRFMALLIFPMYVGLACLSEPAVRMFYGASYVPAIPVMAISLVLLIPKAFYWFPSAALQAADRQGLMFRWLLAVAALNLSLDALLIPRYGAIGAAVANGIAQPTAVIVLSLAASRVCKVKLPWSALGATLCTAGAMGGAVYLAVRQLPPPAAMVAGPLLGVAVYLVLLRVTNACRPDDLIFLRQFERRIPPRLWRVCMSFLEWLAGGSGIPPGVGKLVPSEAEARNV